MKPTDFPGWVLVNPNGKRIKSTWLEVDKQILLSALVDEQKHQQKMGINCQGIDVIIPTIMYYSIEVAILATDVINQPVIFQNISASASSHITAALKLCDERGQRYTQYLFGTYQLFASKFGVSTGYNLIIFPSTVTGGS